MTWEPSSKISTVGACFIAMRSFYHRGTAMGFQPYCCSPLQGSKFGNSDEFGNNEQLLRRKLLTVPQFLWLNFDQTPFEQPDPAMKNAQGAPAAGAVPPAPGVGEKVRDEKAAHIGDHWENGTTWDRCVTRGIFRNMGSGCVLSFFW